MRKLFLFLTTALLSTGLWAADFTVTLDQFRTTPISGLVKIDNSNLSMSGGALQLSSGNKDFVVSTTNENYLIKRIVFTSQKANFSCGGEPIENGDFTPATPENSFTINVAANGGTAKITSMSVTLTTALSETLESLVATALADNTYTTSSSVVTITTVGGGFNDKSGQEYINLSKSSGERSLTISTPSSYVIKSISLNYYEPIFSRTITVSSGTYDKDTYTWTPSTNTNSVKLTFNTGNSEGAKIRRIYVSYASAGYSITYEENGHGEEQEDLTGQFALPNTLPTLNETGWIFGGWYTNEGLTDEATPGASISQNTTLYAKWTEDPSVTKYTVTYDLNGASGDAPTQDDAAAGVEITLAAAPSWEHHTFDGWLCDADGLVKEAGASYTMTAANTTFTAQWTELFAITEGTPANGTVDADLAEAKKGTTITLTATPAFRYLFGAWNVYKTGDESTKVTVTNNKFTMPEYAVTVSATFIADARKQILYLKSSTSTSNDKMYTALNSVEEYNVIVEVPASQTVTNYDLVVLHESLSGNLAKSDGNAMIRGLKSADVPVLNTKSYFYNSDRWDWGTPNAGTSVTGATLNSAYCNTASHPIFEGVTISEGFVTLFSEAKAKAMQPVEPKSGKEGFTLATTSNDGKGTGTTCIQELTPAQRGIEGVSTSKYLLISIGNENSCFDLLTTDGQKLLKNAAAYLLSDATWTPKTLEVTIADGIEHGSVDVDIDCAAEGDEITLSNEPADGYQFVAYDVYNTSDAETKVIVTDGKFTMPAYAVTVSATFAELFAITCSPAENGSVTADKAKAIAGETVTLTVTPAKDYVATNVSYNGTTITPVNDVYSFTMPAQAVTVTATFAKSASGVDNTEVGAKAVKTLKNGVLIIEKNGVRYNMLGERVQ